MHCGVCTGESVCVCICILKDSSAGQRVFLHSRGTNSPQVREHQSQSDSQATC